MTGAEVRCRQKEIFFLCSETQCINQEVVNRILEPTDEIVGKWGLGRGGGYPSLTYSRGGQIGSNVCVFELLCEPDVLGKYK